jgi:hypothetical protein
MPDMDEMSIPKRPPPIHEKEPTIYCIDVSLSPHCTPLGAGTYRVGRYCGAILHVKIDKTDEVKRETMKYFPLCPYHLGERGRKGWKRKGTREHLGTIVHNLRSNSALA